jgi:ATP-dependent Clp protease protease subunit
MRKTILALLAAAAPAAAFMPLSTLPASSRPAQAATSVRMASNIWTPKMMPEPPKPDQAPSKPSIPMPMVSVGEGQMDIYSRLAKDRILLLGTDVNDEMANNLVAQMLFLANEDPGKDITMYSECPATPAWPDHAPPAGMLTRGSRAQFPLPLTLANLRTRLARDSR